MSIQEVNQIPEAFKVKASHYMIAGLSLVVALSWNDTFKSSIRKVYPLPKDQVWAGVMYSLLITLMLIIFIYMMPDTKTALPNETQAKVLQAENTDRIQELKVQVNNLQVVNENLRQRTIGSIERMAVLRQR